MKCTVFTMDIERLVWLSNHQTLVHRRPLWTVRWWINKSRWTLHVMDVPTIEFWGSLMDYLSMFSLSKIFKHKLKWIVALELDYRRPPLFIYPSVGPSIQTVQNHDYTNQSGSHHQIKGVKFHEHDKLFVKIQAKEKVARTCCCKASIVDTHP